MLHRHWFGGEKCDTNVSNITQCNYATQSRVSVPGQCRYNMHTVAVFKVPHARSQTHKLVLQQGTNSENWILQNRPVSVDPVLKRKKELKTNLLGLCCRDVDEDKFISDLRAQN